MFPSYFCLRVRSISVAHCKLGQNVNVCGKLKYSKYFSQHFHLNNINVIIYIIFYNNNNNIKNNNNNNNRNNENNNNNNNNKNNNNNNKNNNNNNNTVKKEILSMIYNIYLFIPWENIQIKVKNMSCWKVRKIQVENVEEIKFKSNLWLTSWTFSSAKHKAGLRLSNLYLLL